MITIGSILISLTAPDGSNVAGRDAPARITSYSFVPKDTGITVTFAAPKIPTSITGERIGRYSVLVDAATLMYGLISKLISNNFG